MFTWPFSSWTGDSKVSIGRWGVESRLTTKRKGICVASNELSSGRCFAVVFQAGRIRRYPGIPALALTINGGVSR